MRGRRSGVGARAFLEAMTVPVWQAMAAVRWLEGRVRNRPKPEEVTPEKAALTDGDCVAQEILLVALHAHFPQVSLSVEEDTPGVAWFESAGGADTVVIDPIDGTLRYLVGDGHYAVLVGLEREGRVEASLVGLPTLGVMLRAERGAGAEMARNGGTFAPVRVRAGGDQLLVSYGLPERAQERIRARGLKPVVAAGAAIGVAPLLDQVVGALRLATSEEGLSHRAWISALPTLEAGGVIEALDGAFPETFQPGVRGLVAAHDSREADRIRELLA